MECYFRSNPSRLGYRKRILELWNGTGLFFMKEQWLVDQANNIRKRGWLTEIELEEIERKIELGNDNRNNTDPDNVTPQKANTTAMSEEEPSIELVGETPNENQDAWYTIKEPFNEEEEKLFKSLVTLMGSIEGNDEIPPMRNVDKKRLSAASTNVDAMFEKITLNNITTLNKVMYCGGIITSELLGVKNSKDKQMNYAMCKKRLENEIKDLCKDFDCVIELSKGYKLKKKHFDHLQRKHFINQKGFVYVMDEMRQRIKSKRGKPNRYNNRVNQYQQNRTFRNNAGMFYRKLNGDSNNENTNSTPDENESREFWKKI